MLKKSFSLLRARARAILIWAAVLVALAGFNHYGQQERAQTTARLGSESQDVRDATVLELAEQSRLTDSLAATLNPNEEVNSPTNLKSVAIREAAVLSVNRLVVSGKLTRYQAVLIFFSFYKDSDWTTKSTSTDSIAALEKEDLSLLPVIVSRLRDDDPDIAGAAVDALTKIKGDRAARLADADMDDTTSRVEAEKALSGIGSASVIYIVPRLSTTDELYRQDLITMLGGIGDSSAINSLLGLIPGQSPATRRLIAVALAKIVLASYDARQADIVSARTALAAGKPVLAPTGPSDAGLEMADRAGPILIEVSTDPSGDSGARSLATLAIGRIGGKAAVSALVSRLGDYDKRIANSAVEGLRFAGSRSVSPLIAVLNDTSSPTETRALAAEALGGIGDSRGIAALNNVFTSRSTPAMVRRLAATGLGVSGSSAAIPTLIRDLGDSDGLVASAASSALLNPALQEASVPALINCFNRPTPVPFIASNTLAQMGNGPVAALEVALKGADQEKQAWSAVTLGRIGAKDPGILMSLAPLRQSKNPQVKWAASEALQELAGS